MHQKRTKKARKDSKNTRRLQRNQEHTRRQICKKRILITKIKNEKGEVVISRKGFANDFGEFYSKLYDDDQYDETEIESDKMGPKTT